VREAVIMFDRLVGPAAAAGQFQPCGQLISRIWSDQEVDEGVRRPPCGTDAVRFA
jgi:hypothetical protein